MENSLLIVIALFLIDACIHRVDILPTFYHGVKEGFSLFKTIFPSLLAFMLMVTLLESSGVINWICHVLSLNVPSSIIGLGLFRPISSSASMAFLIDIFKQYGPDSVYGMMASLMQGATDTTLYVISVYFSQTKVKKSGYIIWLCLFLDGIALFLAVFLATFIQ